MRGLNLVVVRGFMGADPEVREVGKNAKVAEIRLATDESYYNSEGELVEETEWHTIVLWGNNGKGLAEVADNYLTKGSHIEIVGKLKTETWDNEDGETRSRTKIIGRELKIISTPDSEEDDNKRSSKTTKSKGSTKKATTTSKKRTTRTKSKAKSEAESDDDLPY